MSNYSLSVCLTDLQGSQVQANQQGKQFLLIPIEDADLFVSSKSGKVYLNLSMWEKHNGPDQYGKTHGIKQSLSQARQQALGEAAKNIPFIGSAKEIVPKNTQQQQQNQAVYQQTAPQGYAQPSYPQTQKDPFASTNNDLPF
ncbi:MAG: hypothetical protein K2N48_01135 [Muribaculaceae bacterium]|nr:hypothetical protein [Muribaculaceae bacterium]